MTQSGDIHVGTCGYRYYSPPENWKSRYESKLAAYSDAFDAVEINSTFYELPRVSTVERWRREAADDFRFTLKAWQALTHPTSSPTWNDHRDGLTDAQREGFGYLRPNDAVEAAWEETLERARGLSASVCLVQTPPSFDYSAEHESNLRTVLAEIDRDGIDVAWEPRGDWPDNPDAIAGICDDLGLIHVVDVLREEPLSSHSTAYVRLHGLNDDPSDYEYDYSDEELHRLRDELAALATEHDRVFCLFNNYSMFDNASRLLALLQRG